jgi:hypothetical protein
MQIVIRKAVDSDIDIFIDFTIELSKFNRSNHNVICKYDNYEFVLNSISKNGKDTFDNRI